MSVTIPEDYVGKHELAISKGNSIQLFIDRYEREFLIKLFGCELYDSFVSDPATARFTALLPEFCSQDDDCGEIFDSKGLKDMLLGFVYYKYSPDNKRKNTYSGMVVDDNENSRETNAAEADAESRYNESTKTFKALQNLMKNDEATYPEYKGQDLAFSFFGGAW